MFLPYISSCVQKIYIRSLSILGHACTGKALLKPYSEVVTGSAIYGTIGVFLERVQDMSVGSVLFSRLFFGVCMIFIYLLLSRGLGQLKPGKKRRYLLLLGLLNAVTGMCYFSSIRYSGISVAVLLLYTAPVYVNLACPSDPGRTQQQQNPSPHSCSQLQGFY